MLNTGTGLPGLPSSSSINWTSGEVTTPYAETVLNHKNRTIALLEEDKEQLKQQVFIDALTQIPNRAAFESELEKRLEVYEKYGTHTSTIFIDIDNFKQINDQYGHSAGDSILKQTANLLQKNTKEGDFLARFGGEEFVFLLPKDINAAEVMAERLRVIIEGNTFKYSDGLLKLTASFGISNSSISGKKIVENADTALYSAKLSGKNTSLTYTSDMPTNRKIQKSEPNRAVA